jgi:hypothetical protein
VWWETGLASKFGLHILHQPISGEAHNPGLRPWGWGNRFGGQGLHDPGLRRAVGLNCKIFSKPDPSVLNLSVEVIVRAEPFVGAGDFPPFSLKW